jgi:hypothetical protein
MSPSRAEKKRKVKVAMKSTNGQAQSKKRKAAGVHHLQAGAETQKGTWEPLSFLS